MKTKFKLFSFLLLIAAISFSQTETVNVYSKHYETNENTSVFIELNGETVHFKTSPDDKFYINYDVDFKNMSGKKKRKYLEQINIESSLSNNLISIRNSKKSMYLRFATFFNSIYTRADSSKTINRMASDLFLKELNTINSYDDFYIEYVENKYKNDSETRERLLRKHGRFSKRGADKKFVIAVPKNIKLDISTKGAILKFSEGFENECSIRMTHGRLYANTLKNPKNHFKISNSVVFVKAFQGGHVELNNVKKGLIHSIENTKIDSEFSKIEIGEVSKNNSLEGFNNKWIFHNFSDSFNDLEIQSEYSEINMFYPQISNYSLTTYGNNTVHYVDGNVQTYTPKDNESVKMYELTKGEPSDNSNTITINSQHGIIRLAKDNIQINQN